MSEEHERHSGGRRGRTENPARERAPKHPRADGPRSSGQALARHSPSLRRLAQDERGAAVSAKPKPSDERTHCTDEAAAACADRSEREHADPAYVSEAAASAEANMTPRAPDRSSAARMFWALAWLWFAGKGRHGGRP